MSKPSSLSNFTFYFSSYKVEFLLIFIFSNAGFKKVFYCLKAVFIYFKKDFLGDFSGDFEVEPNSMSSSFILSFSNSLSYMDFIESLFLFFVGVG